MSQISPLSAIATQMVSNISILSHISGYGLINDVVFLEFRQKLEDLAQTYLKLVPGMAAALGELDNPSLEQFTEWLMNFKMFLKKQPNLEKAFTDDCYFYFNLSVVPASFYLDDAILTVRSPDGLSSLAISRLLPLSSSDAAAFELHRIEVAADPDIPLVIPERACDPKFFLNLSVFIQAQVFDGILLNILRSCSRNHSQREILPFSSGHQAILHLTKHFTLEMLQLLRQVFDPSILVS